MNPTHRKQKNIADQEHSIHHVPKKKTLSSNKLYLQYSIKQLQTNE